MRLSMNNVRMKTLMIAGITVNAVVLLYLYATSQCYLERDSAKKTKTPDSDTRSKDTLSLVLFDFEHFNNDVERIVSQTRTVLPETQIVVVSEGLIYPPISVPETDSVKFISTQVDLLKSSFDLKPDNFVVTEFVLIIPDGVVIKSKRDIDMARKYLNDNYPNFHAVALPVSGEQLECLNVEVNVNNWTMTFNTLNASDDNDVTNLKCGFIKGFHGVLMKTVDFLNLPSSFLRPFPEALYTQLASRKWLTSIYKTALFTKNQSLFKDQQMLWKHRLAEVERRKDMLETLGIKLIIQHDGTHDWHGCNKQSQRCFGTILNDIPDFVYAGKWTPPCCLHALRQTAHHVFKILEENNVRYWLEGGSLLGAARYGNIIPWDYDIDIGIYKDDLSKCQHLLRAATGTYIDDADYKWEKAREGEFFRVQFSESNHMHIDIFPFYSRDGTMTKDSWFATHKQDREFPEHYLQPLTKVMFVGYLASAPNHVRDFLELKFGKGVIENPKYPDGNYATKV